VPTATRLPPWWALILTFALAVALGDDVADEALALRSGATDSSVLQPASTT
jgi:hypothetical protein